MPVASRGSSPPVESIISKNMCHQLEKGATVLHIVLTEPSSLGMAGLYLADALVLLWFYSSNGLLLLLLLSTDNVFALFAGQTTTALQPVVASDRLSHLLHASPSILPTPGPRRRHEGLRLRRERLGDHTGTRHPLQQLCTSRHRGRCMIQTSDSVMWRNRGFSAFCVLTIRADFC